MMKKHMKGGCSPSSIGWLLVVIGGLNWGLVGLGMLIGGKNWNLVDAIFGAMVAIEAIIYLSVGIATVALIMGCRCKTCSEGSCCCGPCSNGSCDTHDVKGNNKKMDMEEKMSTEDVKDRNNMSEDEQ